MTRDEVLSMKPGRKLDALFAEKVMGWTYGHPCPEGMDCLHWADEKGKVRGYKPPRYSTDISAAFKAEKIAIEKDPAMYVHALASVVFGYNQVQDISDVKKMCLLIHATPEQRCKAALLAVMDGEDENERD